MGKPSHFSEYLIISFPGEKVNGAWGGHFLEEKPLYILETGMKK